MSVLLITAHPDDECMFFAPSIKYFIKTGKAVDLLCLSTGNFDGIGEVRVEELRQSAHVLGIERDHVKIINDQKLLDGPKHYWNDAEILKHVKEALRSKKYEYILSFDQGGISGHPNHCAIARAMSGLKFENTLKLVTLPLWLKYLGPVGHYLIKNVLYKGNYPEIFINISDSSFGTSAMKEHKSQLTWFRRLFLTFSVYLTINVLELNKCKSKHLID